MALSSEERAFWVALHEVDGLGPQRFALMVKYFGSARKAWTASRVDLSKIGLGEKLIEAVLDKRRKINPELHLKTLVKMGFGVVVNKDEQYPKLLGQVENHPRLLYTRGSLDKRDERAIAVVGTRKPTLYGREVAEKLTRELVMAGFTIISGLARGIDSVAHRAAIDSGGRTVAVMATGIDKVYPLEK